MTGIAGVLAAGELADQHLVAPARLGAGRQDGDVGRAEPQAQEGRAGQQQDRQQRDQRQPGPAHHADRQRVPEATAGAWRSVRRGLAAIADRRGAGRWRRYRPIDEERGEEGQAVEDRRHDDQHRREADRVQHRRAVEEQPGRHRSPPSGRRRRSPCRSSRSCARSPPRPGGARTSSRKRLMMKRE